MKDIEFYSKVFELVQSIMTVIGILVGAIWTYLLFVKNREIHPKANVEHKVEIANLDDMEFVLITLHIIIKNCGKVLLPLKSHKVEIQKLIPSVEVNQRTQGDYFSSHECARLGELDIIWQDEEEDGKQELEPNEIDEFSYRLLLPKSVKVISITSFFPDENNSDDNGWGTTSTHKTN